MTRDLPPLAFRAAVRPGSVDAEKRTVEVVWTTGAPVLRGYFDKWYEELSLDPKHVRMARLNNGAPLLDSHDLYSGVRSVLGVVESAKLDRKEGTAVVRFARAEDDPAADAVFRKVKDGIIQNISVGYRTYKLEKQTGGDAEIPTFRATDWEPFEISVVAAGADDGAGFRSNDDRAPNPCVFVAQPQEKRTMEETQPKSPVAPVTAPAAQPDPEAATRAAEAATRAERERATSIRSLVRGQKLLKDGDKLADQLVSEGVSLDKAREVVLTKLADASAETRTEQHLGAEITDDARDKWQRGAAAAMFAKMGPAIGDAIRAAQKNPATSETFRDVALEPGEFRGLTLLDLARESLERRGVKTRGLGKLDLVARAFTFRDVSGMNSTSDFAVLLENVMHKTVLAQYAITPDTWSIFCGTRPASDFRAQNFYRNGTFGVLDSLNEHGEFKNKSIPDGEKHPWSISTKGNIIGITRQSIINDDMGAFTDLAMRLGRAAKLSVESDVYALLGLNSGLGPTQADTKPLFDSAHANVNATGSAIGSAGLDADRVILASQKDPSGNEILDLRPAILVLPVGLGGQARVINDSRFDVDTAGGGFTSSTATKFMLPNRVGGLFRAIVDSPRLSGTRRYLFADPGVAPVIIVGFLDGQQLPYLESELGWRMDGTEWKVRLDYGVAAVDWRGAVTNAGA